MFLGRVTGHVVATQKDKVLSGQKLLVVWIPDVKPEGVIYAEWPCDGGDHKQGYPELIDAATQVLGAALHRLSSSAPEAATPARRAIQFARSAAGMCTSLVGVSTPEHARDVFG